MCISEQQHVIKSVVILKKHTHESIRYLKISIEKCRTLFSLNCSFLRVFVFRVGVLFVSLNWLVWDSFCTTFVTFKVLEVIIKFCIAFRNKTCFETRHYLREQDSHHLVIREKCAQPEQRCQRLGSEFFINLMVRKIKMIKSRLHAELVASQKISACNSLYLWGYNPSTHDSNFLKVTINKYQVQMCIRCN